MKFRKKPVEIEAVQLTGELIDALFTSHGKTVVKVGDVTYYPYHAEVVTLEGTMRAEIGDWIITGVKGEQYPCKNDIFQLTYEEVLQEPKP